MEKLASGEIQHETRREISKKNKLLTGEVTPAQVSNFLDRSSYNDFEIDSHDKYPDITIYIFKPTVEGTKWYIKAYFLEPDVWFISVHF